MFRPSIKRRVMAVVKEKIDAAQAKHDAELDRIEEAHQAAIEAMEKKHETEKEELTDGVVDSLLAGFMK